MPNVPVLSVVDSADGTGGIATISGSSAGSSNVASFFNLNFPIGAWTVAGTRTGDGTIPIPAVPGYYWLNVQSSLAGQSVVSNLVYAGFTSATLAIATQIRAAVQAGINGIILAGKLPGFTNIAQVMAPRIVPNPPEFDSALLPLCLLVAGGQGFNLKENPAGPVVNARDDFGHPVGVIIVAEGGDDFVGPLPIFDIQRERIKRFFISQRLGGVGVNYQCRWEPNAIIEGKPSGTWKYLTSSFVLRFLTREQRGI